MAKKKTNFVLGKVTHGDKKLIDIIFEWAVSQINAEKGYEYIKVVK